MIVPLRLAPVLACTEYPTVPFPVPDAPDVTVIHAALLLAAQVQLLAEAVTPTVPVPPVVAADALVADKVKVHAGGGSVPEIV